MRGRGFHGAIAGVLTLAMLTVVPASAAPPSPPPAEQAFSGLRAATPSEAVRFGLRPGTGRCEGLFEFVDAPRGDRTCTHGPDIYEGAPGASSGAAGGSVADPPDSIPCYSKGPFVRVVYAYEGTSQLADRKAMIREAIAWADWFFEKSARKTGGVRHVRWKMNDRCKLVVTKFKTDLDASIFTMRARAISRGKMKRTEKAVFMVDRDDGCWGFGELRRDDRRFDSNPNNDGGMGSRVQGGCWRSPSMSTIGGSIVAHEILHTLGAVQRSAPNSTPNAHCTDEPDVMCYVDGPGVRMRQVCDPGPVELIDCRNNDYFSTSPRKGSYLARHWNTAMNRFLARKRPPRVDRLPRPDIEITAPAAASVVSGTMRIAADASAPGGNSISRVVFSVAGREIVTDSFAPYEATVSTLPEDGGWSHGRRVKITAKAVDGFGRATTRSVKVTVENPTVRITEPAWHAPVSGVVTVSADAFAPSGRTIASVEFLADGARIALDQAAPFTAQWNTAPAFEGDVILTARATDSAGVVREAARTVVVSRPSVRILHPVPGAEVSGTVNVVAHPVAPLGGSVTAVEFRLDGAIIATDTAAPFVHAWNTSSAAEGSHTLSARVTIAGGATATSDPVAVDVVRATPTVQLTSPADGSTLGPAPVNLSASASAPPTQVDFYADDLYIGTDFQEPFEATWDPMQKADGTHVLWARAWFDGQPSAQSQGSVVTVTGSSSVVSIAGIGPTVSGTIAPAVEVVAPAGRSIGGVALFAGGRQVAYDFSAPYAFEWDTTEAGDGPMLLHAVVEETAAESFDTFTTIASVPVTIANLRVRVTEPDPGETASGRFRLKAKAFPEGGGAIDWVRFYVDGEYVGRDATAPYSRLWRSGSVSEGTHVVRAKVVARDGTERWSDEVSFRT